MRLLMFLILALASCSKSDPPPAAQPSRIDKDPTAARSMIDAGASIIDVREPDEFAAGHLPGAVNFPVDTLSVAEVETLVANDRARPIVVYCAAGRRAAKAKRLLEAAGFTRVVNGGGFDDLR